MKKILTLMMAVLLVALSVLPAFAAQNPGTYPPKPGEDSEYKYVQGGQIPFYKYLISEIGQTIPDLEFKYEITAGEKIDAAPGTPGTPEKWTFNGTDYPTEDEAKDAVDEWNADPAHTTDQKTYADDITHVAAVPGTPGTFAVFAGLDPDKVTVGTAAFTDSDTKHARVQPGDTVVLDPGEVYQKKDVNIDFAAVKFPEPGIYRYVLEEKRIDGAVGITYDTQRGEAEEMLRIIDVYVIDTEEEHDGTTSSTTPKLEVKEIVMHEVKTTVKTTDDMGSKDEKATIATKWAIVGVPAPYDTATTTPKAYPGVDAAGYDTYDDANEVRAKIRERIHDDIVAQDALIDEASTDGTDGDPLQKDLYNAQQAYNAASDAADLTNKEAAYNTAKGAREAKEVQINAKLEELKATTDPTEINRLRAEIDALRVELGDHASGLIKAENDALAALETARGQVASALAALDAAKAAIKAVEDKIAELQALYNKLGTEGETDKNDCIVETEWKLADKTDNYVNEVAPRYDLQFHKKVTGNQGSRDKYFKFTVTITGLEANQFVTLGPNNGNASKFTEAPTQNPATKYDATTMGKEDANGVKDADPDKTWEYAEAVADTNFDEQTVSWTKGTIKSTYDPNHKLNPTATGADVDACVWYHEDTATPANSVYAANPPENDATYDYVGMEGLQLQANASGVLTHTFYLKHDEHVRFHDLTKGVHYVVIEDEEDYKKTEFTDKLAHVTSDPEITALDTAISHLDTAIADATTAGDTDLVADLTAQKEAIVAERAELLAKKHEDPTEDDLNSNAFTGYTNTKNGIIPTGVLMSITGGAALIAIAGAGLFALNRRRDEDDDEE